MKSNSSDALILGVIAKRDLPPYLISFFAGSAINLSIALSAGRTEAWDSNVYYWLGIPLLSLTVFFISRQFPQRPWRWTISMAMGQVFSAILAGADSALGPIAMVFIIIVSVPQFLAGAAGARRSRPADQ
jgi:hypothetical protein